MTQVDMVREFMRMFDHYHFRDHQKTAANPDLDPTSGWTADYFSQGPKEKARTAFF